MCDPWRHFLMTYEYCPRVSPHYAHRQRQSRCVWEGWVDTVGPSTWSPWPLSGRRGMQMCSARPCCRPFFQHLVAPGVFGVRALRDVCLQMFCCVLPLGMGHRREQSQGPRSCFDHKLEQPLEGAGPPGGSLFTPLTQGES